MYQRQRFIYRRGEWDDYAHCNAVNHVETVFADDFAAFYRFKVYKYNNRPVYIVFSMNLSVRFTNNFSLYIKMCSTEQTKRSVLFNSLEIWMFFFITICVIPNQKWFMFALFAILKRACVCVYISANENIIQ